jgi:ABC-type multidrug transport system ATPase subunit
MNAIEGRNLTRRFAPRRGVCGVSFDVAAGECWGLLGRNGSGKTTLTRLLLGLDRPSSGTLTVLGEPVHAGSRKHLARCGAAFDRSVHWDGLTAWQNAWFVARRHGLSSSRARRRLGELFALADLDDRARDRVAGFSFGMRRKLSLIEALVCEPELLILDEPTAGLDEAFLVRLTDVVRARTSAGLTTWLAGNDADWLAGVATKAAFIDAGQIVAADSVEALLGELGQSSEVKCVLGSLPALDAARPSDMRMLTRDDHTVRAVVDGGPEGVGRMVQWLVAQGAEIRGMEVHRGGLREAFLIRTGRGMDE